MGYEDDDGKPLSPPFEKLIPDPTEKQLDNFVDFAHKFGAECDKQLMKDKKK